MEQQARSGGICLVSAHVSQLIPLSWWDASPLHVSKGRQCGRSSAARSCCGRKRAGSSGAENIQCDHLAIRPTLPGKTGERSGQEMAPSEKPDDLLRRGLHMYV